MWQCHIVTQSQKSKKTSFRSTWKFKLLELYTFWRFLCDMKSRYLQYFLTKQDGAIVSETVSYMHLKTLVGGLKLIASEKVLFLNGLCLISLKTSCFDFSKKSFFASQATPTPQNPQNSSQCDQTSYLCMQNVLVLLSAKWNIIQIHFLASEMP